MANAPNAPIPATGVAQGAPPAAEAPALPFNLPETMTAAQAEQRLVELRTDADWQTRWRAGDVRANSEFDQLTRRAVNQRPATPTPVPDENAQALAALGAPADISGYDLNNIHGPDGGFVRMDEAIRTLATTELLPAARGLDLSQSDVAMIASNVANPTSYEDCEAVLHKLWPGDSFEAGLNDFRLAMAGNPKARVLVEAYPETLGNSPMLISAVVAAFRRRQARSR